jgi:hypothetical protein
MRNPLYIRSVRQLIDAFCEVDALVDNFQRAGGSAEQWQLQELSARLAVLLPKVDTIPLPGAMRRSARDLGDFFYLLQGLSQSTLNDSPHKETPTVREVRKYDTNPFEASIRLDEASFNQVLVYRAKAREALRRPAENYGLSCDTHFAPHSADAPEQLQVQAIMEDLENWAELDEIFRDNSSRADY